ncbi:MAG: ABC-type transport auxiliary lipoprotein family protein [Thermodesulfobacteriota bacterium]
MKNFWPFRKRGLCWLLTGLWAFSLLFFLVGCGKPPTLVQKYLLEYPSPVIAASPKIGEVVKVDLFSVAQAYNSPAMIYQPGPFKSDAYNYHRWRVNPGNLVTDYLVRDLRNSGLFKAVLLYGSSGKSRFLVEGGVEEFQETDAPEGWYATLALNITLLDLDRQELPERVVFQKNYRTNELLTEKSPQGLAQGMSRAMQRLSGEIMGDIYRAAAKRAKTGGK